MRSTGGSTSVGYDLFADALYELYETGRGKLFVERDDGLLGEEEISWYLDSYRTFPRFEKQALKFARGRVLDIGCGAGRHALYLQARGLRVTGIDKSEKLARLAHTRGVRDIHVLDACGRMPFRDGEFDTIILFGNNLGICGSLAPFRRMLRELGRITARNGRILATTRMANATDPVHRAYLERNLTKGRPIGQVRLRLVYAGRRSKWFDLLLFSPLDLMQITLDENWRVAQIYAESGLEEGYSVVMEKQGSNTFRPHSRK